MTTEKRTPETTSFDPETAPHILVVDDDDRIRTLLLRFLKEQGFIAVTAPDAAAAETVLEALSFDLLIVDVMMPGETGVSFTRRIRNKINVPVLLLTALGEAPDRISGLEAGADDYLAKPFDPRELVLRIRSILRRSPSRNIKAPVRIGRWSFDLSGEDLQDSKNGETIRLTGVEANLLRALAGRADAPVSREELAQMCGVEAGERTIDVQVTRLRKKLDDDARMPRLLQTVRGKGYLLRTGEGG